MTQKNKQPIASDTENQTVSSLSDAKNYFSFNSNKSINISTPGNLLLFAGLMGVIIGLTIAIAVILIVLT